MITYQVETFNEVIAEIKPLLEDHYHEIATDKEVKPLDPDWGRYEQMEAAGILRIMTARHREVFTSDDGLQRQGKLVGYFISVVLPNLHYQQTMQAINDVLYIHPDFRGGVVAYLLFEEAIEDLKNLKADILTIHMKTDYPFRSLLAKLGFHLTEENWEKVLK